MAENKSDEAKQSPNQSLDLSALSGLDFGPSWIDGKTDNKKIVKQFDKGRGRSDKSRSPKNSRDRRLGGRPERKMDTRGHSGTTGGGESGSQRGQRSFGQKDHGRRGGRRDHNNSRPSFQPTVKVDIYPQDEAFDALVKRLVSTARTYQLFEIAQLLLEKPERFVIVVGQLPSKNKDAGTEPKPLFYSVPGHLPFDTEEAAVNHVLSSELEVFFDIEPVEVEPPSGNFQVVNRCGVTGELLGPPNYHLYQEFLQRHYANKINGMAFERFTSKIETVKEQAVIDEWLESMKKGFKYILKDRQEGEPESFDSLEAVRIFLLQHRKGKVVGSSSTVRFAGRDIERMPRGLIRRSVEVYIEQQKRFPLDSANNIRGRLRRHNFTVYKKGGKGISYVCAVKRKFRDSKTKFSDSIKGLIEFIEQNPNIHASKLPTQYIGIDVEKYKTEKLKVVDTPKVADAEAATESPDSEETAEAVVDTAPVEAVKDAATLEPKQDISSEEKARLDSLMVDLRWLITEGYVTEYGDGRLFAAPPMPEPKKKEPVSEPAVVADSEAQPKLEVALASETAVEESVEEAKPEESVPVVEAAVEDAIAEPKVAKSEEVTSSEEPKQPEA